MPYIITTTTYPAGSPMPSGQKKQAVAALEEAHNSIAAAFEVAMGHRHPADLAHAYHVIGETGGMIGPLPDGTVIEVKQVSDQELVERVLAERGNVLSSAARIDVIDAYNAAQEG